MHYGGPANPLWPSPPPHHPVPDKRLPGHPRAGHRRNARRRVSLFLIPPTVEPISALVAPEAFAKVKSSCNLPLRFAPLWNPWPFR